MNAPDTKAESSYDSAATARRVAALLDTLGIDRAHAACVDLREVPVDRVAALALVCHRPLAPEDLLRHSGPTCVVATDRPPNGPTVDEACRRSGARRVVLPGYEQLPWSDVVRDHTDTVFDAITVTASAAERLPAVELAAGTTQDGEVAGIRYRMSGSGPPLMLLPLSLVPSQWTPIMDRLAAEFTTIRLSGPHVGATEYLEERARTPSYSMMLDRFLDLMAVPSGGTTLEVGCGSGAVGRRFAARAEPIRVLMTDINAYLRDEAVYPAARDGRSARVEVVEADATRLPFADNTFDGAYSVTALEECNADAAIAELVRVSRPGSRVGVIVRASDIPQLVNIDGSADLLDAVRDRYFMPGTAEGGCADASLYRRLVAAGLNELTIFPTTATFDHRRPPKLIGTHVVRPVVPAPLRASFQRAVEEATELGVYFITQSFHCAVGRLPAGRSV